MQILAIAVGGAAGALARYGVTVALGRWLGTGWPFGTLVVNVLGSVLLGVVAEAAARRGDLGPVVALVGVGFCGAFTTFSTFGVETVRLLERGDAVGALVSVAANVLLACLGAALGVALARGALAA